MIRGQPRDLARIALFVQGDAVDVEAPVVDGGHEEQTSSVGREARLDVDCAVLRDRPRLAALGLQKPELDGVVAVRGVGDETAVGRPVRLIIITGAIGDLQRHRRSEALPPQGPLHRVDDLGPVGRPGDRAGPRGRLGQVHLAVVIMMRQLDLLQDDLAHGRVLLRHGESGGGEKYYDQRPTEPSGAARHRACTLGIISATRIA